MSLVDQSRAFNAEAVTNKLSATFRTTTKPIGFHDPRLKRLQTTFMYFIDDIQRGPVYDASKQSIFVLHWINKIGSALNAGSEEFNKRLDELVNTSYTHQNFYTQQ